MDENIKLDFDFNHFARAASEEISRRMIQKTVLALNKTQILEVIHPNRKEVLENYKH